MGAMLFVGACLGGIPAEAVVRISGESWRPTRPGLSLAMVFGSPACLSLHSLGSAS